MLAWWDALPNILKVLYCVAIPSTLIFLLDTVLMLFGLGDGAAANPSDTSGLDVDGDFDADVELDLPDFHDVHVHDVPSDQGNQDVGHDIQHPGDDSVGLKLFTLQGILIFLVLFSWISIAAISTGLSAFPAIVIGLLVGFAALYGTAKLFQFFRRMQENGALSLRNALGQTATVYIPIPPNKRRGGKVTLTIQGSFTELDAITEGASSLSTGTVVTVIDIQGDTLVVEPMDG